MTLAWVITKHIIGRYCKCWPVGKAASSHIRPFFVRLANPVIRTRYSPVGIFINIKFSLYTFICTAGKRSNSGLVAILHSFRIVFIWFGNKHETWIMNQSCRLLLSDFHSLPHNLWWRTILQSSIGFAKNSSPVCLPKINNIAGVYFGQYILFK